MAGVHSGELMGSSDDNGFVRSAAPRHIAVVIE